MTTPDSEMPAWPVSVSEAYAGTLKDLKDAFVGAGFSNEEAMQFCLAHWTDTLQTVKIDIKEQHDSSE